MQIVKTKKTSLLSPFNAAATSFTLREFTDHKGNALVLADFDNLFVVTLRQSSKVEMVLCNGLTQNADGSTTIAVATNGRDLSAKYPYTGGAVGEDFSSGAEAVNGDDPYTVYQITIAYSNSLVISGAPNATIAVKGISEVATAAELDADAADGSGTTNAALVATPSKLATSKYGLRLPSAEQKIYLNAVTGMIIPYAGDTAPTGFLNCDGIAYSCTTYDDLALILKGKFGYGAGVTVTAATTDIFNATSHGLLNNDVIFFSTSGTLPAGITANTPYYVRDVTGNTFKVSLTLGGAAVDVTSTGSGTHSFHNQFKVPDLRSSFPMGQGQKTHAFSFLDAGVNTTTNIITLESNNVIQTGMPVVLSNSGGALPTGSVAPFSFSIDANNLITGSIVSQVVGNDQVFLLDSNTSISLGFTPYYVRDWVPGVSFKVASTPGGAEQGANDSGTGTAHMTHIKSGANYYAIRLSATTFKLALTAALAVAGTAFDIVTAAGGGTHTLTVNRTSRLIGDAGGEENHLLTTAEMPSHTHRLMNGSIGNSGAGYDIIDAMENNIVAGSYFTPMEATGGDTPHNILPVFVVVNYLVKT